MAIALQPPIGVPPLWLGMSMDAAELAMSTWGTPGRSKVLDGAPPELWVRDEEVLTELARRGVAVDLSDELYPECNEVTLGLNRSHERGYFESVLVAKPWYYTADFPGIHAVAPEMPRCQCERSVRSHSARSKSMSRWSAACSR